MRTRLAGLTSVFISMLAAALPAFAQEYPNRPVTIVAPSAPGGLYSQQRLGKPFVGENRPGAGSVVACNRSPARPATATR